MTATVTTVKPVTPITTAPRLVMPSGGPFTFKSSVGDTYNTTTLYLLIEQHNAALVKHIAAGKRKAKAAAEKKKQTDAAKREAKKLADKTAREQKAADAKAEREAKTAADKATKEATRIAKKAAYEVEQAAAKLLRDKTRDEKVQAARERAIDRRVQIALATDPGKARATIEPKTLVEKKAVGLMQARSAAEDVWVAAYMAAWQRLVDSGKLKEIDAAGANIVKSSDAAVKAAAKKLRTLDAKLNEFAGVGNKTYRQVATLYVTKPKATETQATA